MTLSQQEIILLRDALHDAYNYSALEQMLFFQLSKDLQNISLGGNFREVIFDVIRESLREGWTDRLVHAAHDANPGNQKLKAFTNQYLRFKGSSGALEKIIRKTNGFIDVFQWRTRLARIERQVCSIEFNGLHEGTGFLIAEDLILTNYHVVRSLLGDHPSNMPDEVRIRFDFKISADGKVVNDGTRYELAATGWNIDSSPYSAADTQQSDAVPTLDELDFAVLKLAPRVMPDGTTVKPGMEPVQGSDDKTRGWISLPQSTDDFKPGHALFIVQHPSGQPLKMAFDTDGTLSVNANGTRYKYKTNTEPGSSGSPCFDSQWKIVALHHYGDKNKENPEWNQGIPIHLIANRLTSVLSENNSSEPTEDGSESSTHSIDDEVDDLLNG